MDAEDIFNLTEGDFTEDVEQSKSEFQDIFIESFNEIVINQERAARKAVRRIMLIDSGIRDQTRPVSPLIFAGPPGTGKTLGAETIARLWIGEPASPGEIGPLVKISGENFQDMHAKATLLGAPTGYIGSGGSPGHERKPSPLEKAGAFEEGKIKRALWRAFLGWLNKNNLMDAYKSKELPEGVIGAYLNTEAEELKKRQPFRSVVLVDEFEKMHQEAQKIFLSILDRGVLETLSGPVIDFRNCLFIFTSNIGSKEMQNRLRKPRVGFAPIQKEPKKEDVNQEFYDIVLKKVEEELDPALYSRIGKAGIVVFQTLTEDDYMRIISSQFQSIQEDVMQKMPILMYATDEFYSFILEEADAPQEGAREIGRLMEKYVRFPLAQSIISGEIKHGDILLFTVDKNTSETIITRVPRSLDAEEHFEDDNSNVFDEKKFAENLWTNLTSAWANYHTKQLTSPDETSDSEENEDKSDDDPSDENPE